MAGSRQIYKESQRDRVHFPDCGKYLAKGSLAVHGQNQHGMSREGLVQEGDKEGGGDKPKMFRKAFLSKAGPRPCPV